MSKNKNIFEILKNNKEKNPDKIAFDFVSYDESGTQYEDIITFRELYDTALSYARYFKEKELKKNDKVIIISNPCKEVIASIYGCIMSGIVFILIPKPNSTNKAGRLTSTIKSCGPKAILFEDKEELCNYQFEKNISLINLQNISADTDKETEYDFVIDEKDIVCLQYTSGSISAPKGIMFSNKSIMFSEEIMKQEFSLSEDDIGVNWLPIYHSMGLLVIIFKGVYNNSTEILLSPETFSSNPENWMKLIDEKKATFLIAPNSGYLQLAKVIDMKQSSYDMSQIKHMVSCSETIYSKDWDYLWNTFRNFGLKRSALKPMYGLSEATGPVSIGKGIPESIYVSNVAFQEKKIVYSSDSKNSKDSKELVDTGNVCGNLDVKIVNPDTLEEIDNQYEMGEIWVSGDSVADGYYNLSEETKETFNVHIANDKSDKSYLRTGDIGVIIDGRLYVTGRIKEMVVINGHNIFLKDVENIMSGIDTLKKSALCAFATNIKNKERLIISIETENTENKEIYSYMCDKINFLLTENLQISAYDIVFLDENTIRRTDNGKISANKNKLAYENFEFKTNCKFSYRNMMKTNKISVFTDTQLIICDIFKNILSEDCRSTSDDFMLMGGDSLSLTILVAELENRFALKNINIKKILEDTTVSGIADYIDSLKNGKVAKDSATVMAMKSDIHLANDIWMDRDYPEKFKVKTVFLTGTTGFLAAFILRDLINSGINWIYCLVRAKNESDGLNRIIDNMKYYEIWDEKFRKHIIPVLGDLTEQNLGIESSVYETISEETDLIVHSGAWLNFMFLYKKLREANVFGTEECIRLAFTGKPKYFHYVSSFSVFDNPSHFKKNVYEDDLLTNPNGYFLNYSETKWVSEKLIQDAKNRGLRVTVSRPGDITGAIDTGIYKLSDYVSRLILGCVQLGTVPDEPIGIMCTPVDYVSEVITHIVLNEKSVGKCFNILNPHSLVVKDLKDAIKEAGFSVELIPYKEWVEMVKKSTQETCVLKPLDFLFNGDENDEKSYKMRYTVTAPNINMSNTNQIIFEEKIHVPVVDKYVVAKYIHNFLKQNKDIMIPYKKN